MRRTEFNSPGVATLSDRIGMSGAVVHLGRRFPVLSVLVVGALVVTTTACGSNSDTAAHSTSTVTTTVTAQVSQAGVESKPAAGAKSALRASFQEVAKATGMRVGIALAPVGRTASATVVLGESAPGVAWSTIKVPLAIAAEREHGASSAESNAIINSDNAAAESLWASLGTNAEASTKVTAVLREGGNTRTQVPDRLLRPGFTVFGQTQWTLPDAAAFTGHLPCMAGTEHVVSLMGQVAGNQQWGVEIMAAPQATAVKGGWGPGVDGAYLVRQIGLITFRDGRRAAVAMSASGSSMSAGIAALNTLANWLNKNIGSVPRGRC